MALPSSISLSDFVLVVGIVGGLMLIVDASLRPMLENAMDRASRRLRIEVHDDRKIVLYIPEGIELHWAGESLDRVVQQEIVLENYTRDVFHEVQLRLRFKPYNSGIGDDRLLLGVVVPPTPNTDARLLPMTVPGERIVEMDYISPQSEVNMLVFTKYDGDIEFDTLCDREIVVRHTGSLFSENAQKVMPSWMSVLKPIVLPFTIAGVIRRQFLRRKTK